MRALVFGLYIQVLISSANICYGTQATLAWDPSPDPTVVSYNLYYGSSSRAYTNVISCGAVTSITVSNLVGPGTYYFAATAINSAGLESDFSGEVTYQGAAAATCQVTLSGLSQTYDGTPKCVSYTAVPAGVPVNVTYNGSLSAPTSAGSYLVVATVAATNYSGGATNTLVIGKAIASVQCADLQQVYDGTAKVVSVSTVPSGLSLNLLYNGSSALPVNAGVYQVTAVVNDANYGGGATNTLIVSKAIGMVQLTGLSQVYDGSGKRALVSTTPAGLPVSVTYNGNSSLPVNAGSYQVVASIADSNYLGSVTGTLVVAKAVAAVQLASLVQTYDGTPKGVSVVTTPANLAVALTYSGTSTAPTNAGSYVVVATVTDSNYAGGTTNNLVVSRATATIQLGGLNQVYDGTSKPVTGSTVPSGLSLSLLYNGSALAPTNAGTYSVEASVADLNHLGSVTNTLVVARGVASIQFSGLNAVYDGNPKAVGVSSTPAALPCTVTYNGLASPPINAGSVLVVATICSSNYTGDATNTLTVSKASASIAFAGLNQIYDGMSKTVSATTLPLGLPVQVTYNGLAVAPIKQGTYVVVGTITHSNYLGTATNTLTIAKGKGRPGNATPALANRAPAYSQTTATEAPRPAPTVRWAPFNGTITLLHSTDLVAWDTWSDLDASTGFCPLPRLSGSHFFKALKLEGRSSHPVPLAIEQP